MARTKRAHLEWVIGIVIIAAVVMTKAPAWVDALIAVGAACGWCYALERSTQEVTE